VGKGTRQTIIFLSGHLKGVNSTHSGQGEIEDEAPSVSEDEEEDGTGSFIGFKESKRTLSSLMSSDPQTNLVLTFNKIQKMS
jgi:hypothetical protein